MRTHGIVALVSLCLSLCVPAYAQGPADIRSGQLETIVKRSRIETITPRSKPPTWLDYEKVRRGFSLLKKHQSFIDQILATSSLSSTFAARDIAPVLMQTGRLPRDFSKRMGETVELLRPILQPRDDKGSFISTNLQAAYNLGRLHQRVAEQAKAPLGWNSKERVPLNQQSYALVLCTFAWWPIEALEATQQIDVAESRPEVEGWFHFWSVVGYEMGVSEDLLPSTYDRARTLVALLKAAQYTRGGPDLPDGVPSLLGGQVRWMAEMSSRQPGNAEKPAEQLLKEAAGALAQVIHLSPGLSEALGLGADAAAALLKHA